jgi:hypothetical protein
MLSRFLLILTAIPLLFLTSCIEGEEEIWMNWDASGKIRVHFELPPIFRMKLGDPKVLVKVIRDLEENEEGIEIQELYFKQVGSKLVFHLEATFDDATDLLEISERNVDSIVKGTTMDPAQLLEAITGSISVGLQGLDVSIQREINLEEMFPELATGNPKRLGSSNFRYQIHLPFPIKSSNAHAVTNDGKSLEWIFILKEYTKKPMGMSLDTRMAFPRWVWAIAVLFLLGFIFLVWKLLRRRAR